MNVTQTRPVEMNSVKTTYLLIVECQSSACQYRQHCSAWQFFPKAYQLESTMVVLKLRYLIELNLQ